MVSYKTITKLKSIQAELQDNVKTNISVEKALTLIPTAAYLLKTPDNIHRFTITEEQAPQSWSWNGEWILLPDQAKMDDLLKQAGMK